MIIYLLFCIFFATDSFASPQEDFFESILPSIKISQEKIKQDREYIKKIDLNTNNQAEIDYINYIADQYKVKSCSTFSTQCKSDLLTKVNYVPTSVTMAQAALESGFGSSRFAREGNAYFGQWCFTRGCGLRPVNPNDNKPFFAVKSYETKEGSIDDYMLNVNRHASYKQFREQRKKFFKHEISASKLVETLTSYSRQGKAYPKKLQYLIKHYHLEQYD